MRYSRLTPWLFIAPMLVGLLVFRLGPIAVSLAASFTDWNVFSAPRWIGTANYAELASSSQFAQVLRQTLAFSLIFVPGVMVLSLALALLVNRGLRGSTFFRGVFFMPYITSVVAVALAWNWVFATQFGLLNQALRALGVSDPPSWLGDSRYTLPVIAAVSVWKSAGFQMLLFLAGLQNIPEELREAARIDGASEWRVFTRITLPLLSPVTFFVLIVSLIASSHTFEITYAMTEGGPQGASTTLAYFIYQSAFQSFRMGFASAAAYVLLALVGGVTLINFYLRRRWVNYA